MIAPQDTSIVVTGIVLQRGAAAAHAPAAPAAAQIRGMLPDAPCRFVRPVDLTADLSVTDTASASPLADDTLDRDEPADFDITVTLPPGPCSVTAEVLFEYADTGENSEVSVDVSAELCPAASQPSSAAPAPATAPSNSHA